MRIEAYTDGSCSGNPGPGGYAAILTCGKSERKVCGGIDNTTNNGAELKAVIAVIDWLNRVQKKPCEVIIHTDSQYICNCTAHKTKKWFTGRKNEELWMELIEKGNKGKHHITFVKVEAHAKNEMNNRVDKMAREECLKAKKG